MKLFNYLKNILLLCFKCKYYFQIPSKKKILIFDEKGSTTLKKIFKFKNYYILSVRGERVNLFIFIKLIFSFQKINLSNYIKLYIELLDPSLVFHHSLNYRFFLLKKNFTSFKTIFIQSEFINKHELKRFKKEFQSDYCFLWGKNDVKNFKKYFQSSYFLTGSLLNNFFYKKKSKNNFKILFISQYREAFSENKNFILNNKKIVKAEKMYKPELFLLNNLIKFCKLNKKFKPVILCSMRNKKHISDEINFYKKNLGNEKIAFKYGTNQYFGYKCIYNYKMVVFISSTLGYEFMSSLKPSLFLNIRKFFLGFRYPDFSFPDDGICWTSSIKEELILKKIAQVFFLKKIDLNKNYNLFFSKVMSFDKNNKKIKKIIKSIIDEKNNFYN